MSLDAAWTAWTSPDFPCSTSGPTVLPGMLDFEPKMWKKILSRLQAEKQDLLIRPAMLPIEKLKKKNATEKTLAFC